MSNKEKVEALKAILLKNKEEEPEEPRSRASKVAALKKTKMIRKSPVSKRVKNVREAN